MGKGKYRPHGTISMKHNLDAALHRQAMELCAKYNIKKNDLLEFMTEKFFDWEAEKPKLMLRFEDEIKRKDDIIKEKDKLIESLKEGEEVQHLVSVIDGLKNTFGVDSIKGYDDE